MQKCVALIVAAGRGSRFGEGNPKQYHLLNNRMVLRHTIAKYAAHPLISGVKVVIHPDDADLYKIAVEGLDILSPCFGGKERQDSVRLGLQSLADVNPDVVLIHDGARPFVSFDLISDVIAEVKNGQGAIAALPVTDTIKIAESKENHLIKNNIDRSLLWRAQTPQAFRYNEITAAHQKAQGLALTDDAAVAENSGIKVALVKGDEANIKITTLRDLEKAEEKSKSRFPLIKVGYGFDVHAFTSGDAVTLCGVKIPFAKSLLGHSDADVALHALADALYGAIGAGDIGSHFPPSDNKWKNADSSIFVKHSALLIKASGGVINNVDITIVCEAPKIANYRAEMIKKMAKMLEIPSDNISVKGTTTEKLGFTGREEGIAATAVASVAI